MEQKWKKGDTLKVTKTVENGPHYSTNKETYHSLNPINSRLQAGETFTISGFLVSTNSMNGNFEYSYYYKNAEQITNLVPEDNVVLLEDENKISPKWKVDDVLEVVGPLYSHELMSTLSQRYFSTFIGERYLRCGERIVVAKVNLTSEGYNYYYIDAGNNYNLIPQNAVRKPVQQKESSPKWKCQDVVKVVKPIPLLRNGEYLAVGENLTIAMLNTGPNGFQYYYKDADGRFNLVPEDCVELVNPVEIKVGDQYEITKEYGCHRVGDIVTVSSVEHDVAFCTEAHGVKESIYLQRVKPVSIDGKAAIELSNSSSQVAEISRNILMLGCIDVYAFPNNETIKTPPVDTEKPIIKEKEIKAGDWVKAVDVSHNGRTTNYWADRKCNNPLDRMQQGEIFQVLESRDYDPKDSIAYMSGSYNQRFTMPASSVVPLPEYKPPTPIRSSLKFVIPISILTGVSQMQSLMNDPAIHETMVWFIRSMAVAAVASFGWVSTNKVASGIKNFTDWRFTRKKEKTEFQNSQDIAKMVAMKKAVDDLRIKS